MVRRNPIAESHGDYIKSLVVVERKVKMDRHYTIEVKGSGIVS